MSAKRDRIKDELLAIAKRSKGILHAESVVNWARGNPRSALYKQFVWNDAKAAKSYRIWQARQLIAVHVVSVEGDSLFVSLSIDRSAGGGYRQISDVIQSRDLSQIMLRDAIEELERVQVRYERVKVLTGVWALVAKVKSRTKKKAR